MRRRAVYPLLAAAVLSSLLHGLLAATAGRLWSLPELELDFPIEASLQAAPPEMPPAIQPPSVRPPATLPVGGETKAIHSAMPAEAPPEPIREAEPSVAERLPEPAPVPLPATGALPAQADAVPEEGKIIPAVAPRLASHGLPARLRIQYAAQVGDNGFTAGRATYHWVGQGGRYSLVSTLEAIGLAALFVSGRIVQTSEGGMDATGLRPERYWLQRGERKQDTARFEWSHGRIVFGGDRGAAELAPQAQDLLSFPFHLALTAREGEPDFSLAVTNGRKIRDYSFQVLGVESVQLPDREVNALHLRGSREKEGTLDVWLARDELGIPVRVRTQDQAGKTLMLLLEGMETGG